MQLTVKWLLALITMAIFLPPTAKIIWSLACVKLSCYMLHWCVQFVGSEEVMESSGNKIAQAAIGRIRVGIFIYI